MRHRASKNLSIVMLPMSHRLVRMFNHNIYATACIMTGWSNFGSHATIAPAVVFLLILLMIMPNSTILKGIQNMSDKYHLISFVT
jgi:hypothetical protein